MRAWIRLTTAGACALLAQVVTPRAQDPSAAVQKPLHAVLRPFALPMSWRWLDRSSRAGNPVEELAACRQVLTVVPEWTEGHLHAAWLQGHELALEERDAERRAGLLAQAMTEVDTEARRLAELDRGIDAAELWLGSAALAIHRSEIDPAMSERFRQRFGRHPQDAARAATEQAFEIAPGEVTRGRLGDAVLSQLRFALDQGDLDRAETLRTACARLFGGVDAPSAQRLATSLDSLGSLTDLARRLQDDSTRATTLEALASKREQEPWLTRLIDSLIDDREDGSR